MEADNRSSSDGAAAAPAATAELPSVNECQPMDDSQPVGAPGVVPGGGGAPAAVDVAVKAEVRVLEKRKRGRPPKGQAKAPPAKKLKEEEDVCFICFDGGSLVLCDRRGCPKAYHPACIKRDEAFFRSRAKWTCGWHICSSCQKAAHYMCYTCTYSLCKACTKYADYVCVRENKGFCTTCLKTIMLIENNGRGNIETPQVDFDDKTSWEYLFKVYWVLLKEELSLTLDELTQAQNPWKAAGTVAYKAKSLDVQYGGNNGKGSIPDNTSGQLEAMNSERTKELLNLPKKGDSPSMDRSVSDNNSISVGTKGWASKELLEFVAHMRNGDTSVLSQFDVQTLLLDYIKRNNLRDPHQKSQIICDLRLRNLFGKPRLGHIEMLKLLEFHCLTEEDSRKDVNQGNIVHAVVYQVEGDGSNDNLLVMGKQKKHKTRRKGEERGLQTNLDEHAAIDVHNIKLIYLRRNLMESLIVDNGNFHDKVVGSFVRIRISSGDQSQDMYRLVEVVGTCKVAVPYKIGERTSDLMLEILNLDKKESISIDAVSNQEFSEDECQQLRQSVKCGLVKGLTVGQVQQKAMALQEVRFNDWLEAEIMRLNHLRDRANEKGHKKELRECVEKIELLKTPEERQRRLHEIPEVHVDPSMDPSCQADEDSGVNSNIHQDGYVKSGYSGFSRNGKEPNSAQNRSMSSSIYLDKEVSSSVVGKKSEPLWKEEKDAHGSIKRQLEPRNQVDSSGSVIGSWNNHAGLSGSFSGVGSEASVASLSAGSAPSGYDSETEKLWFYRDPNGNVQGPFCMVELRKWSTTGFFPHDMRIWSANGEEGDSLLLTDVLNGQLHKGMPMRYTSLPFQEAKAASIYSNTNSEFLNGDGRGSHSSGWTRPVANTDDMQTGSSSQCSDSPKVEKSYSDQPQVHSPVPSFAFPEKSQETSLHQVSSHEGQRCDSSPNHGSRFTHGNIMHQTMDGQIDENQSNCHGYSGQSIGESQRSLPVSCSSNNWDSSTGFASVVKSIDPIEKIFGIDINLPSPIPKINDGDWQGQATKDQQSVPANTLVQDLNMQNLPSSASKPIIGDEKPNASIPNVPIPLPKPVNQDDKVLATENKQSVSSNFPVQDSVPSWSSASSLVVGSRAQVPEVAGKWGGYAPTCAKPSFEEWDSGFVSSLKPTNVANDHAPTPTSNCDELTTPSPPHAASSWLASVTEPIEISTLIEESVSDLLAEVDAMESQGGMASPTSVNGGEDLFQDSKTECFTSHPGLVAPLDSGKTDALGSTGDIRYSPGPLQLTVTDEQIGAPSQAGVLDPVKRSGGKSSTSTKVEVETKQTEPSTVSRDMIDTATAAPRARVKPIETGVGTMPGSTQGITNTGRGSGPGTARGSSNTSRGASAGSGGRESHPKHGGERLVSPRDRTFQSRDSGSGRDRSSWARQSSIGSGGSGGSGGGGGSYSRPAPKGQQQRVCKFYESGYCKKGAFCNYLHPR